ncbi:MAG: response regulator transcription factor [Thermaerobacter sp.]|nr:response regulator transcription factor [Thermaerobacter sp.]
MESDAITVVVVEDQELVRDAITRLLNLEPDLHVVAAAQDGTDGIRAVRAHHPAVVLLDIELPAMSGLQVAEVLRRAAPTTVVAMLTTFARPGYLERALAAGALGFLLKEQPVAELATSIRRLARGERVIDQELAQLTLASGGNPLSQREQEVLRRAARGESADAIGRAMYLSAGTVRNYLSSAMQKLEAPSRAAAVHTATQQGWI